MQRSGGERSSNWVLLRLARRNLVHKTYDVRISCIILCRAEFAPFFTFPP